jgi:hypothetical protein
MIGGVPMATLAPAASDASGLDTWARSSSAFSGTALVVILVLLLLIKAWWRETGRPPGRWLRVTATSLVLLFMTVLCGVVVIRFLVFA